MKRLFMIALVALSAACVREETVVIVSTNDMHAAIDDFPRLATLVERIRTENPGRVLLVDGGDRWTGNPFVDLAERPLHPIVELMNELGYDVATLGNHEFDRGQALLRERLDEMDFPAVCANIESHGAELGYIPPYAFIETGGIRFAFLGLVTNFTHDKHPDGKAEHFAGLTFPDVYETAERYARLADSCDVFVGLTHIGHTPDTVLARRIPSLDLIIGAHSHTVAADAPLIGNTLVTQAGSKSRYAGVTTVTKRGGKRGGITIENRLVALDTIAPMPCFGNMVARYNADPALLAPIGETAGAFNEQGVENMVADAVHAAVRTDIALYHVGGIRVDTLAAGALSTADLFRIEPFASEVYTLRMTPGQIKGLVINKFNDTVNAGESHRPDLVPGGFAYTIITDEAGEATDVVFDRPERASYTVALPDYVYKNYSFDRTCEATETRLLVTDILRGHISRNTPLRTDNDARIAIE